jgi:hypothetical protein
VVKVFSQDLVGLSVFSVVRVLISVFVVHNLSILV